MTDDVRLHGFSIGGYRSFPADDKPQRIGPLGKVHLLAGPNNSGKSNALRAVQQFLESVAARAGVTFEDFDRPYGEPPAPVTFGVGLRATRSELLQRIGLSEPRTGTSLLTLLETAGIW